ncbi:universal stress protein [Croceicoccus sp. YJ47]|uniref:universal stress protein n=1 Tax=Croceicoccus sp. YJ47 TaxID=2798724 RepID=UPI001F34C3DB|nr:universal stress protein [Croceicoccus sp. YJ47]
MTDMDTAHEDECVLACIDSSPYAAPVVRLASWAARRLDLPVEILHVVQRKDAVTQRQDLSGAIGLGVKGDLLEELTELEEKSARLEVERGRALLKAAHDVAIEEGAPAVRLLHRHGGIVENVIEREEHARTVIIGKRGASHGFAREHLGSKVERVVRASSRPVLVANREAAPPTSLIVAFDGSKASRHAVNRLCQSPVYAGLPVTIVIVGADDRTHRDVLTLGVERLREQFEVTAVHRQGKADQVIAEVVKDTPGAMLVMGAYGHSPLRQLIVGSTTTSVLRMVHAPVMLAREG